MSCNTKHETKVLLPTVPVIEQKQTSAPRVLGWNVDSCSAFQTIYRLLTEPAVPLSCWHRTLSETTSFHLIPPSLILYAERWSCLATPWRNRDEVEVLLHSFLASALYRGEQSISRSARFNARETPHCPLNRRLGGSQSRSEHFGGEKNHLPLSGFEIQNIQFPYLKKNAWTRISLSVQNVRADRQSWLKDLCALSEGVKAGFRILS